MSEPITAVDANGYTYTLVRDEVKHSDGISDIELWDRTMPPDEDYQYTRDLPSKLDPAQVPVFLPIAR